MRSEMTSKDSNITRKGKTSIPAFFSGKSVFITGATGFMGKILLEKLLRSCPEIERIFILMRPKKGKSLKERVNEMISLPLFVRIRREDENIFQKIIPINGDTSKKNLGINEEDRKTLIDEVSIVFHVAATVRFDSPLKDAVFTNLRATYDALELAKQMKNIEVFLHVSTAYTNTHKPVIEEKIYPAPADWRTLIDLAENMDKHELEIFSAKLIYPYPNTYTYTKQLAEHCVQDYEDVLPCIIFRPTIVTSTYNEPMPGWIDNFNGPIGLSVAGGKGLLRCIYGDGKIVLDYVPVDLVTRAMIVATWEKATSRYSEMKLPVYNCSSYGFEKINHLTNMNLGFEIAKDIPFDDILWTPNAFLTKCKFMYYLGVFFLHLLPAIICDSILSLTDNKKISLLRLHRKIFIANIALEYFSIQEWSFINDKLLLLDANILERDREAFSFNVRNFNITEYYTNSVLGVRHYLLKEDNLYLPEAKAHARKMYLLDKGVKVLFILLVAYMAVKYGIIHSLKVFLIKIFTELYMLF